MAQEAASNPLLLTPDAQQNDFLTLRTIIFETVVDPYATMTPTAWDSLLTQIERQLTIPQSQLDFYFSILPAVQALEDIHTRIWLPQQAYPYYWEGGMYLPVSVRQAGQELIILKDKEGIIPKGSVIRRINGHDVDSLFALIVATQFTDGKLPDPRTRLAESDFMSRLGWFLPLDSLVRVDIKLPTGADSSIAYPSLQANTYKPPKPTKEEKKVLPWSFSVLDSLPVAVMSIKSFSNGGGSKYYSFLRESFQTLDKDNIPYLIIDIRKNTGGYLGRGEALFRYLIDAPTPYTYASIVKGSAIAKDGLKERFFLPGISFGLFPWTKSKDLRTIWKTEPGDLDTLYYKPAKPFKPSKQYQGEIILLTDGLSISNSALFRNAMAHYQLGTNVGTTVAGLSFGTYGNSTAFKLPLSGISGTISTMRVISHPRGMIVSDAPILPEHIVDWSVEDWLNQRDTQLEYALNLIKASLSPSK